MKKENVEIKEDETNIEVKAIEQTEDIINQNEYLNVSDLENTIELSAIYDDKLVIENAENIEIFGNPKQRQEMLNDWSLYFAEVTNPDNTTVNKIFGGAKYSPLNEVLNTVRPIMGKYGLSAIQVPYMYNSDVAVKTIITHKSGAIMSFPQATTKLIKPNNAVTEIQAFGSASSYLRRFTLNAIAGVMGEIDNDGNSEEDPKKNKQVAPKPNPNDKLKEDLTSLCKEKIKIVGKDSLMAVLMKYEEKGTVAKMTPENVKLALVEVEALIKEENK